MVDVARLRGRGRAAVRHRALGDAAVRYASVGWPAPGAHPVSPAWQMQATVDLNLIRSWWQTRPEANVILVTGRVFDVLDIPAAAGAAALARMDRDGAAAGPLAVLGDDRMLFFVTTRGSPADEDEWWSC